MTRTPRSASPFNRWPLEYSIGDVTCSDTFGAGDEGNDDEDDDEGKAIVVYITEDTQVGCAPAGGCGRRPATNVTSPLLQAGAQTGGYAQGTE